MRRQAQKPFQHALFTPSTSTVKFCPQISTEKILKKRSPPPEVDHHLPVAKRHRQSFDQNCSSFDYHANLSNYHTNLSDYHENLSNNIRYQISETPSHIWLDYSRGALSLMSTPAPPSLREKPQDHNRDDTGASITTSNTLDWLSTYGDSYFLYNNNVTSWDDLSAKRTDQSTEQYEVQYFGR